MPIAHADPLMREHARASAGWIPHTTEYDRLNFHTVPYQWYLDRLRACQPFALARWSDGEWPCVLGQQGANTDRHPYSPELRRDLTRVLLELAAQPPAYLVGLQELVARQHPLNERVHGWMVERRLTLPWVSGEVFHRASIKDQLWALIDILRQRSVILVGPARLAALKQYFPIRQHIEIPLVNCHAAAPRVLADVRQALHAASATHAQPIVSFSASMSTKYLIHELVKSHPDATLLDIGAVWEPYVGVSCRKYHPAIITRLQEQQKLGGAPTVAAAPIVTAAASSDTLTLTRSPRVQIAVCTAQIGPAGSTDPLYEPTVVAPGVRYFCGTDTAIPVTSVWQPIQVPLRDDDPVLTARQFKICIHQYLRQYAPETDVVIWVDAAYRLQVDPSVLVPSVITGDLGVLIHPHRSSIIAEARAIADRRKPPFISHELLTRQVDHYLTERYPDQQLSSTGLLVRRCDRRTEKFNEAWWRELYAHQHTRDQMSFDYTAWKLGMAITWLEGHYRANPYAVWHHHR